jgi:hypothetical protein
VSLLASWAKRRYLSGPGNSQDRTWLVVHAARRVYNLPLPESQARHSGIYRKHGRWLSHSDQASCWAGFARDLPFPPLANPTDD